MHPNAQLNLAAALLQSVMAFDGPAAATTRAFFTKHSMLGARERRVLADTVFRVLRHLLVFTALSAGDSSALHRRLAILGWQGRADDLARALDEPERQWLALAKAVDPASLPLSVQRNLPSWLEAALIDALAASFGAVAGQEIDALVKALAEPAPLDLRVNTMRAKRDEVRRELLAAGVESSPTPLSPWGLRVVGKPSIEKLTPFIRGDVEVQDEGSQVLALLTDARRGEMVIDFCAGAGGKTLALGASMRDTGRLYVFDTSGHRLDALKPRLARSGLSNTYTMQIAHERDERLGKFAGKADRVLVDTPCSGLGTLRRNPDLAWRHSPATIARLRETQVAILRSAAQLVRPGGRLVYATCSLLLDENETVASDFSAANRDFALVSAADELGRYGMTGAAQPFPAQMLRLWPHHHATDGFFAAIWQRR